MSATQGDSPGRGFRCRRAQVELLTGGVISTPFTRLVGDETQETGKSRVTNIKRHFQLRSHGAPWRAALLASCVAVSLLPAPPAAAATADAPWSGYRLATDGTAAGGWIGGRKASRRVVYRIDPAKKPRTSGFGTVHAIGRLTGSGPRTVTAGATARAAWIVGKYGSYRYAVQNAAVDAALYHLLYGGAYSVGERKFRRRTGATPYPAQVRSFAETMLRDSDRYAGPYRIRVSAPRVVLGSSQKVSVRVTSTRSGAAIPNLPVRIVYPGKTAKLGTTNSRGTASAWFTADVAGPRAVRATVRELPETRLWVRRASTRGASRVVLANIKTRRTVSGTVAVQARPVTSVASRRNPMLTSQSAVAGLSVTGGYPAARRATAALYGPFTSQAAAICSTDRLATRGYSTVTGNGSYRLPLLRVPRYGWYVWGVSTAANSYNTAAWTCGAHTLAKTTPYLKVVTGRTTYAVGGTGARARATVDRLPAGYTGRVTFYLYGGVADRSNLRCGTPLKSFSVDVAADGTYRSPYVALSKPGYYAWRARVSASTFSVAKVTGCKAADTVFRAVR